MLNLDTEEYGIWWYKWKHGKSRWKTLLIYNDAIHVQVEKWGENNNAENIITPKVNNFLCTVHDLMTC
jgi:hypothetical protein